MRHLLAASPLLYAAIPLLVGCSATLDFDSVVGGSPSGDGDDSPIQRPDAGAGAEFSCDSFDDADDITFCDDFDGAQPESRWRLINAPDDMARRVKADSEDKLSGETSLLSEVVGGNPVGTYEASAALRNFESFTGKKFTALISFDVKISDHDQINNGAKIGVFQFLFGVLGNLNQLVLNVEATGSSLSASLTQNDPDGTVPPSSPSPIAAKEWVHVEFELDVNEPEGTDNYLNLRVGDETIYDGQLGIRLVGVGPRMEIGIPAFETSPEAKPWAVRHENVLVIIREKE